MEASAQGFESLNPHPRIKKINIMKTFKLLPIDGRKTLNSHHVNQYEVEGEVWSDLISYNTRVASYNHTHAYISIYNCQSQTTRRHINAFLSFYGFDTMTKKEMELELL